MKIYLPLVAQPSRARGFQPLLGTAHPGLDFQGRSTPTPRLRPSLCARVLPSISALPRTALIRPAFRATFGSSIRFSGIQGSQVGSTNPTGWERLNRRKSRPKNWAGLEAGTMNFRSFGRFPGAGRGTTDQVLRVLKNTNINNGTLYPHRAGVKLQRGVVPTRLQSGRNCGLGGGKFVGRAHRKPKVIPADVPRTLRGDGQNRPDFTCEIHCLAAAQSISQALKGGGQRPCLRQQVGRVLRVGLRQTCGRP